MRFPMSWPFWRMCWIQLFNVSDSAVSTPSGSGTRRVRVVAGAAAIVAIAGYLILVVAASRLGPERYSIFASFWSALYLAVGSVFGIQQEVTRQVALMAKTKSSTTTPRLIVVAIGVSAVLGAAILLTSSLWAPQAFQSNSLLFVVLIAAGVVLYAGQSVLLGSLAGRAEWGRYSIVLIAEAVSRLGFVLIAVSVATAAGPLAFATVAAMGIWLVLLFTRVTRQAVRARGQFQMMSSVAHFLQSIGGASASAILVTGFPLLLSLSERDSDRGPLGVVILVITLTRAPVLVPMNAFLGMLIGRLSNKTGVVNWSLVKTPFLIMVATTFVVAVGGYFAGSPLISLVFGHGYVADSWFVAGAAVDAGMVGILSLTGVVVLASEKHGAYLCGWLIAALASALALFLPIDLQHRVLLSLAVGPLIGIGVHVLATAPNRTRS